MNAGIVYLRTKKRMPVRLRPVIYLRDIQQDIPVQWCIGCKRELYDPRHSLCRRCEGVKENVKTECKSLR